jgi:hypothetical protein
LLHTSSNKRLSWLLHRLCAAQAAQAQLPRQQQQQLAARSKVLQAQQEPSPAKALQATSPC